MQRDLYCLICGRDHDQCPCPYCQIICPDEFANLNLNEEVVDDDSSDISDYIDSGEEDESSGSQEQQ